jgi:uncharacterized protein with HEPN domain
MSRSDLDRLRDARDFAGHARDSAGGLSAGVLAGARQPQHAALFALIIVGEAFSKVSGEVKSAAPRIPWRQVINMRHRIVHAYWMIDPAIIADVIEHRLEPLVRELSELIGTLESAEK